VLSSFVLQFYDLWVLIKEPTVNLRRVLKVPCYIVQSKQEVSRSFSVSYLVHCIIIIIIIVIIIEHNSGKH